MRTSTLRLAAAVAFSVVAIAACHGATPSKPLDQVPIGVSSAPPKSSLPSITVVPPDQGVTDEQESREVRKTLKIVAAISILAAATHVISAVAGDEVRDAISRVTQWASALSPAPR